MSRSRFGVLREVCGLLALICTVLAGCSESTPEKALAPFKSSLSASKTLAGLGTDFSVLCTEVVDYRKAQLEAMEPQLLCTAEAMSHASTKAACTTAATDCEAVGLSCSSDTASAQCALTVKELQDCVTGQARAVYATRQDVSCSKLANQDAVINATSALLPDACGQAVVMCPELHPLLGLGP